MNIFKHSALTSLSTMFSMAGLADTHRVPVGRSAASQPPKFEVDKTLFPFDSRFMTLNNGARIHYVDEGEGPVLLLLHGNPAWSFLYRHIIRNLKKDFRIIAPDYPGFGLSTAPEDYTFTAAEHSKAVAEFVERMQLQDITIMGQDWGGPIGFDFAIHHLETVKAFVIGNTWAWPLERRGQKIFSAIMGGRPGRFITRAFNGVARFFMWRGVRSSLSKDELAMYLAPFQAADSRAPTHIFPRQLAHAKSFLAGIYQNLDSLSTLPVLIVWGQEDFAFQQPERTRFEELFPNHETILLNNAGHFIQEDAPDEISVAISNWYARS